MPKNNELIKAVRRFIDTPRGRAVIYKLDVLEEIGFTKISRLPYSIRILLENVVRNYDGFLISEDDIEKVGNWPRGVGENVVAFIPTRVILQDYTGIPLIVDLAAMREVALKYNCDPKIIDAMVPVHLIIDHSIQVDYHGTSYALEKNIELEFKRYSERYKLLKWAQTAFTNLKIIPPAKGIIHQINIEYLAKVIDLREFKGEVTAFPDTVIGTDSHTTMVNGIGVLGWGVGGIEAEAVLLGQPYYITLPEVIGVKIIGEPREGVTATDIVLSITEFLRKKTNVVGKFVEFFGPGLRNLSGFDRTTIANMAPEYGSTIGFFPIDDRTLEFLLITGRRQDYIEFIKKYTKLQHLFYDEEEPIPEYTQILEFDLSSVEPSISGPSHPEDRIPLHKAKEYIKKDIEKFVEEQRKKLRNIISINSKVRLKINDEEVEVGHGMIVIAAIASCTNTSNPHVMIGAGLVAKKAIEYGLRVKPWVKTSLAPGSRVVLDYLEESGLMPYLKALGFHIVGFGCTTCIGNSGPLLKPVEEVIKKYGLYSTTILSGNRNFAGRIHPLSKANFLMSPMLVIAYALKGTMNWDPLNEPIGFDPNGKPIYLKDIWPKEKEIREYIAKYLKPNLYIEKYQDVFEGTKDWIELEAPTGSLYKWDERSTWIKKPPFFEDFTLEPPPLRDIKGARVLLLLGDRVTTDHISPAGPIPPESPAGKYLLKHGVKPEDFGTYGARRGNHEVMVRGTFFNPRCKNLLLPEREGGWTIYWPTKEVMTVYDAAMKYMKHRIPLIIIAGKQYGAGSSRDWAAKGPYLLGVKAVIAESFERIHRSNLVGMGILPLQFMPGENWRSLGLRGDEIYDIIGISEGLKPHKVLTVIARKPNGSKTIEFNVIARLDNYIEVKYYRHGGILKYVLRKLITKYKGQGSK